MKMLQYIVLRLFLIESYICDALRDLLPFAQFKKREKCPWRSVNFSKVAGSATLLKLTLLHACFSRFLNCADGTKSRNAPQIRNKSCLFLLLNWSLFLKTGCFLQMTE